MVQWRGGGGTDGDGDDNDDGLRRQLRKIGQQSTLAVDAFPLYKLISAEQCAHNAHNTRTHGDNCQEIVPAASNNKDAH